MIVDVNVSIIVPDTDTGDMYDDEWLMEQFDDFSVALEEYIINYGFKINEVTFEQRK